MAHTPRACSSSSADPLVPRSRSARRPRDAPAAQRVERIEPGPVAVVPGDLQGICAVELCVGDAQRIWSTRPWPPVLSTLPQRATRRTRTTLSKLHQPDPSDVAIGEPNGDALVSFDLEIHRLVAVVHIPRLPDPRTQTTPNGKIGAAPGQGPRSATGGGDAEVVLERAPSSRAGPPGAAPCAAANRCSSTPRRGARCRPGRGHRAWRTSPPAGRRDPTRCSW